MASVLLILIIVFSIILVLLVLTLIIALIYKARKNRPSKLIEEVVESQPRDAQPQQLMSNLK